MTMYCKRGKFGLGNPALTYTYGILDTLLLLPTFTCYTYASHSHISSLSQLSSLIPGPSKSSLTRVFLWANTNLWMHSWPTLTNAEKDWRSVDSATRSMPFSVRRVLTRRRWRRRGRCLKWKHKNCGLSKKTVVLKFLMSIAQYTSALNLKAKQFFNIPYTAHDKTMLQRSQ